VADTALAVGAASRPHPGETVSGDAWAVHRHRGVWRLTVVDGLGHGPDAAGAAAAAIRALAARPELEPLPALEACHVALRGTRGAAVSVASISAADGRLTYAGVGNVEARLCQGARVQRLVAYRGIVGGVDWRTRAFEYQLGPAWTLVLHTDGVRARFGDEEVAAGTEEVPQVLARALLDRWARPTDDATVVVARPAVTHWPGGQPTAGADADPGA
jgi:serine phosphatase RsbU (regulator of sigma subunit)